MMRLLCSILLAGVAAFLTLFAYNSVLPPVSTLMMGRTLTLRPITRDYVPLSRISPHMVRAVIAAEDGKFCAHRGIDWQALSAAAQDFADDSRDRSPGASTITMQLTKNLFLWPGRSVIRKGIEIPLALGIDAAWSKRRIMENYLNVAEFGPGIFGVETASRRYFRKPARALTAREAALLAATLPSPKRRNPARPSAYVAGYAGSIEARMWQQDTRCLR